MEWMIIRHGETAGNAKKQYIGVTDQPLTKQGIRELKEKKARGCYSKAQKALELGAGLFVSPMLRCRETAELIFPGTPYTLIPELREMDFGEFEGKSYMDLSQNPEYQKWIDSNGELPFPGGESRETFKNRVLRGVDRIREIMEGDARADGEARADGGTKGDAKANGGTSADGGVSADRDTGPDGTPAKTAVIVAHGGTIMAANQIFNNGEFYDGLTENGGIRKYTG